MPEPSLRHPLSAADIHSLNQILVIGGVKQFYAALEARGYAYANWAHGVAAGMGMDGHGATDYLRGTALMGISSPIFQILNPTQIKKLRFDLAKAYLRLLNRLVRNGGMATVARDLDASEAQQVHAEGLQRNGLAIENWNLHFPLQVLRRLRGEAALAIYWPYLRDVRQRAPHIGLLANLATTAFMYRQATADDLRSKQMACAWLARNPCLLGSVEVERRLALVLKTVQGSGDLPLSAFLAVLDISQQDRDDTALTSLSQRTDRKARVRPTQALSGDADCADRDTDDPAMAIYRALMKRLSAL